jgi:hypothetical protein
MRYKALSGAIPHRIATRLSRITTDDDVECLKLWGERQTGRRTNNQTTRISTPNQTETSQHKGANPISELLSLVRQFQFQWPFVRPRPCHKIDVVILFFHLQLAAISPLKGPEASKPS